MALTNSNFKCSVCLEYIHHSNMKINNVCGHANVCGHCLWFIASEAEGGQCPVCRTFGNYISVYIEPGTRLDGDDIFDNKILDITSSNSYDPRVIKLNEILDGTLSDNYKIITEKQGGLMMLNTFENNSMIMAFYGTESDIYNNYKPTFIDVTCRIKLAMNVKRSSIEIRDDKLLCAPLTFKKDCDWILIILCST